MSVLPTSVDCLILTDIHGCANTLVRLLNAAPKGVQLVFLGDLIDRGPSSRAVVELAIDKAIPTTMGNHESLALAFYHRNARCAEMYESGIWLENGGKECLRNWPVIDHRCSTPAEQSRVNRDKYLGGRVPDHVLDWMEQLPAYLYPSTQPDANGRRLLCSHSGYGLSADDGDWFQALWGRHAHGDGEFPDDNLFRTVGHTLTKKTVLTDKWIYLDTGAAYGKRGYGNLSAMVWPSKQIIIQSYDESPVISSFTIEMGGLLT